MNQAALGFYWTLPVPWAGFSSLPDDVDAAAKASRTIRYQRELVRRYAKAERWTLVDEVAFLEMQPDRGTETIKGPLGQAVRLCRRHDAHLLIVDFSHAHGWRGHDPLRAAIEELGVRPCPVYAEPVVIDGETFDPFAHFTRWREKQRTWTAEKPARQAETIRKGRALRDQGLSHAEIAKVLNDRGIRSASGKSHTAESVRKAVRTGVAG